MNKIIFSGAKFVIGKKSEEIPEFKLPPSVSPVPSHELYHNEKRLIFLVVFNRIVEISSIFPIILNPFAKFNFFRRPKGKAIENEIKENERYLKEVCENKEDNSNSFEESFEAILESHEEFIESRNVVVSMKQEPLSVLSQVENQNFPSRLAKFNAECQALQDLAQATQKHVIEYLESMIKTKNTEMSYKSLWLTNQIIVKCASAEVVNKLKHFPQVRQVEDEIIVPLIVD